MSDFTLEERNAHIVKEFKDHHRTMQDIGDEVGLTRERVRQIVESSGVDVTAVRAARTERREAQQSEIVNHLAELLSPTVQSLAEQGSSRAEALEVLKVYFPEYDQSVIGDALRTLKDSQGIVFSKSDSGNLVSGEVIRSSLLFAYGENAGLVSPTEQNKHSLDYNMTLETARALSAGAVGPEETLRVINVIAATAELLEAGEAGSLAVSDYDDIRARYLDKHPALAKLRVAWPVGSLTIGKRLGGGWNAALSSLGFKTNTSPEGLGAPQYTPEDYETAIREFIAADVGATYADYDSWVRTQKVDGVSRPVGASVRNAFGDWSTAYRAKGSASLVNRATERAHRASDSNSAVSELIGAQEDEYDRLTDIEQEAIATNALTPELQAHVKGQKEWISASLRRYQEEEDRWNFQKKRWDELDKAGGRQFKINLWLAIAVGAGSTIAPLVVWGLEKFWN